MASELYVEELGDGRCVKVLKKNDEITVDIREFDDEEKPTSKGHTLTLKRWKQLCELVKEVDETIEDVKSGREVNMQRHLGGNVYVSMNDGYKCVNVRYFMQVIKKDGKKLLPTKDGIALRFPEWTRMTEQMADINQHIPGFDAVMPCYMESDHCNQLGYFRCPECNPNHFTDY